MTVVLQAVIAFAEPTAGVAAGAAGAMVAAMERLQYSNVLTSVQLKRINEADKTFIKIYS
jgi:TRAP-type mannitol/chloroaromatic compound transport system permease large subunit